MAGNSNGNGMTTQDAQQLQQTLKGIADIMTDIRTNTDASTRQVASDAKKAEEIKKKVENIKDSIKTINDSIKDIRSERELLVKYGNQERDILDEIRDSEAKLKKIQAERKKNEAELKKAKNNELKTAKLLLESKRLEKKYEEELTNLTKKRIEVEKTGYNQLDRFEKKFASRTKLLKQGINEIKEGVRQIGEGAKKMLGPWGKMSQAAADYAKHIGLSGKAMDALRKRSIELVNRNALGIRYNVGVEQLMKLQEGFTKATGRQVMTTNAGLESMAATSKILGENTGQFMGRLENFGLSMEEAGRRAGKMFANASKRGLAWENYSKAFLDNISLAQRYNFRNGLQGLASMAEKASQINLNMSQAASFAEKVNTVEGAITTGAQLQVLGGPFARMADPLGMLYEGLNDLEGLQDRMIQMFGNLGTFNRQTGEVEISSFNRQRIRAASQAMGLDVNNVYEAINSNARRNEIARQLAGNSNIDKDTAELLKNVGIIQNGKAGAVVNGRFKAAKDITSADAKYLREVARTESEDVKDIAQRLRGWEDSVQGFKAQKDAAHASLVETSGIGKGMQSLINDVGEMRRLLTAIALGTMVAGAAGIIGGGFKVARGLSHVGGGVGQLAVKGMKGPKTIKGVNGNVYKKVGDKYYKQLADGSLSKRALQGGAKDSLLKGYANRGGSLGKAGVKFGKLGAKIGKASNPLAWGGLGVELLTDYGVSSGKIKRGGALDYAGHIAGGLASGAGTGAWLGGMIGSVLPGIGNIIGAGIGTAIGAAIGGITGLQRSRKNTQLAKAEEKGVALTGNYTVKQLREINAALNGDTLLSDKLRAKMEKNGDIEAIDKINNFLKNEVVKVQVVKAQKFAGGGITSGATSGDKSIAAVSGREMVLTQEQQAELFSAIDSRTYAQQAAGAAAVSAPTIEVTPASVAPGEVKINAAQFGQLNRIAGKLGETKLAPKMGSAAKKNPMEVEMSLGLKHERELLRQSALALNNLVKASAKPSKKEINKNFAYEKELLEAVNNKNEKVAVAKPDNQNAEIKEQEFSLKAGQETAIVNAIKDINTTTNVVPRVDNNINVSPTAPIQNKPLRVEFDDIKIAFEGDDINIKGDAMKSMNISADIQRQLETMITQNVALQIQEALNRMQHAGRKVPERGLEYSIRT